MLKQIKKFIGAGRCEVISCVIDESRDSWLRRWLGGRERSDNPHSYEGLGQ